MPFRKNRAPSTRAKSQAKQQTGGNTARPSVDRLPKETQAHSLSNITQRQSTTHQRDKNQLHLPVGRPQSPHQEAYSKPPYQLQPQGGRRPEVREATTLLSIKRSPHQKPIKMKGQRTITQIREKGKNPRKVIRRCLASRKKTLDC